MDFIDRIFYMAVDDTCKPPDMTLHSIYKDIGAGKETGEQLDLALEQLGLNEEQAMPVTNAFWKASFDYERQGFINGFRFGMMLYRELLDTIG